MDLVAAERLAGRRVLVHVTQTGTRDITGRMEEFLGRHGFPGRGGDEGRRGPARAPRDVGGETGRGGRRRARCHPRLVQTGLDLVEFPMICWYETEVSVF